MSRRISMLWFLLTVAFAVLGQSPKPSLSLTFPIVGLTANTAVINSIFDHRMDPAHPYATDGIVEAYTGETGKAKNGVDSAVCYQSSDGTPFVVNGSYSGAACGGKSYLSYDGHSGYDFAAHSSVVVAAADGVVVTARSTRYLDGEGKGCQCYGNYIVISHNNGAYETWYGHLKFGSFSNSLEGMVVTAGTPIAITDNTGESSGEHLHFEVRQRVSGAYFPVDPYGWSGVGQDPYKITNIALWAPANTCASNFSDEFNRPDGSVGNGWLSTLGNTNGDLVIQSGALSAPGPDGNSGIYRPIDLSQGVIISATLTQGNGFGGLLSRYDVGFRVGATATLGSGYGINFYRADQTYNDSAVNLILNGTLLASLPSSFQFGSALATTVTFGSDGSITGSVAGDGHNFNFSFGPRAVTLPGSNFAILQGFSDSRSAVITNPTVDNLAITYPCSPLNLVKVTPVLTSGKLMSLSCSDLSDAPVGYTWFWAVSDRIFDGSIASAGYLGGSGPKPCGDNGYIFDLSSSIFSPPIPNNSDVYLTAWASDYSKPVEKDGHLWPGESPVYYGVVHWDGSIAVVK